MQEKVYFIEEWEGKKYNHLTIKDYQGKKFICQCDCGRECAVKPTFVLRGRQKTCGNKDCPYHHEVFIEIPRKRATTHGGSKTRLYKIWQAMKDRCGNPNNTAYKDYGGRGITVCKAWLEDFAVFQEWALSNGYSDKLSIDRIDVNGGYSPKNCRWADAKTQRENQRPRTVEQYCIGGRSMSRKEWLSEYGVSDQLVHYYEKKYEYSFEDALKAAKDGQGKRQNRSADEAKEKAGIPKDEWYKYFVVKGKVFKYRDEFVED